MKPLSERNPIAVAIVGLVLLGLLAFAVFDSANLPIIGGGTGYTAYFAEAAGLQAGNEVRVAGVIVGRVTGISLAGDKVAVNFKVKGAWVGNDTTAAIKIKTLLGDKFLALDPLGTQPQNPATPIPLARTTSPYDVTQAFNGLGQEVSPDQHRPAREEPADARRGVLRHAALHPLSAARARLGVPGRSPPVTSSWPACCGVPGTSPGRWPARMPSSPSCSGTATCCWPNCASARPRSTRC